MIAQQVFGNSALSGGPKWTLPLLIRQEPGYVLFDLSLSDWEHFETKIICCGTFESSRMFSYNENLHKPLQNNFKSYIFSSIIYKQFIPDDF